MLVNVYNGYVCKRFFHFMGSLNGIWGGKCVCNSTVLIPTLPVDHKLSCGFQGYKAPGW